ncbi:2-oxo-4-hydroxy-4-carboxy-5-ureidoimidazoline decarboxylase [Micrococcoides hystricis]|uniref:2-oxo-4-hydroxy-4-carboxy-5-ureidoimidazoline decarboxylase n=1 Tax=Micrococcoides hystricis TaxID=1572761 RepID=A0ABV6PCP1_9MICC
MQLSDFNAASEADAIAALKPCLDIERWCAELAAARPFNSMDDLVAAANRAANPLTPAEVDQALSHHPRIGERAEGEHKEATLSRAEQSGLGDLSGDTAEKLAKGNAAYEEKFDQVFLIRAAGRSKEEVLSELERRMNNTAEEESAECADQLRQIAVVRLEGLFS